MTRYILLQFEQGEWRVIGYPQMKYPNTFERRAKAMDVAWGLYAGYNEEQVRRLKTQARPRGWRLPSVMAILKIKVPALPFGNALPKGYQE